MPSTSLANFTAAPAGRPGIAWRASGVGHVAVYGTLRAGGCNDMACLRPGTACVGRTTLTGTLHDMGWYPGLRLGPGPGAQLVLAEVYALDAALERQLDRIEGLWPEDEGEYAKRVLTLPVALIGGGTRTLDLLIYEALPAAVRQAPVIDAGDWLAWYAQRERA